jgi:hypothetical membrane protein
MSQNTRLMFGPLAAVLLAAGVLGLPLLVPGYDPLRQTVSEIGQVGSPARWPFTAMLVAVALALLVFATAVWTAAPKGRRARIGAVLIAAMGVSAAGVGWYAYPHPLHNVFGLSELIGYLAPLAVAVARPTRAVGALSWVAFALLWGSILINLAYLGLFGEPLYSMLGSALESVYGLVQRALFLIWFGWCAALGLMLRAR